MAWTKLIVVVDEDVDVHSDRAVAEAVLRNCHVGRDLEIVNGPLDILDHASPRLGAGHKIGIDATRTWPGEEVGGIAVDAAIARPGAAAVREAVARAFGGPEDVRGHVPESGEGRCAVLAVRKTRPGAGADAIERLWRATPTGADMVAAVDASVDVTDIESTMFHVCANADPGRDLLRDGERIGIDATAKMPGDERNGQPVRDYPPILRMADDVRERVDARAEEFGLA